MKGKDVPYAIIFVLGIFFILGVVVLLYMGSVALIGEEHRMWVTIAWICAITAFNMKVTLDTQKIRKRIDKTLEQSIKDTKKFNKEMEARHAEITKTHNELMATLEKRRKTK